MRSPLQDRVVRDRSGTSYATHIAAPTGGLNTRDSVVNMDSRDALVMDNYFPQANEVWQRAGFTSFATGMNGLVKALAQYSPAGGADQLIAFTNTGAYNISAGGVISGVMTGSAITNGYVQTLNMTNSAGDSFLWVCNAFDTPQYYNGTTWATAAITGPPVPANASQAWIFKHRIWFIEQSTMNAWYLEIDSIQGAASQYPMGNLFRKGGFLVAGTNWTLEGGDGPDDAMVLISSEGELAVFQGTDPNSASSWSLSGIYDVGKPAGSKCFFKLGGDVGLITENGVFPLSRALQLGSINFASALSNKVQPSFSKIITTNGLDQQGYEGCVYPKLNALLINLPKSDLTATQYVMNTITGQWCTFSGWNAQAFCVFNGQLYFSRDQGRVEKAWTGPNDSGINIVGTVHQAYQFFGSSSRGKSVRLLRFLLEYDGSMEMKWAISPDYVNTPLISTNSGDGTPTCAVWDISDWDTSWWCQDSARKKDWKAAAHAPGYALSLRMSTSSLVNDPVKWAGTDFIIDSAGMM